MFSEQRIEVAGYPGGGTALQPLLDFVERDYLRSGIQKQSLTVTWFPLSAFRDWDKLNEKKFSGLVDPTAPCSTRS